jgi:hypothetical protein
MGLKKGGLDTRLRRYPGPTRRGGLEHLGEFMSSYTAENEKKVTIRTFRQKKEKGEPIAMLTAYDYPVARALDKAGILAILVVTPWR